MEQIRFPSRRSVVHSRNGMAAATQPLAAAAGIKILDQGGNAADAAVAMAAAMGVVEPMMTGIGGDAFCLFYNAKSQTVEGFNGSGKSSSHAFLDAVRKDIGPDIMTLPTSSGHAVTVPGAPAAWVDIFETWGSKNLSFAEVLAPGIELAKNGYPVSAICARMWAAGEEKLRKASPETSDVLLPPPKEGELFTNPLLAAVYERVAAKGKAGFYEGRVAEAIVEAVNTAGGKMDAEDLKSHSSLWLDPLSMNIGKTGVRLHELPPNNHGIVALIALGIVNDLMDEKAQHNSAEYLHLIIEALKFAFKDAQANVGDPDSSTIEHLLSPDFIKSRARLFDPTRANLENSRGAIPAAARSDTAYFVVADKDGNACSIIASLYFGFGSGIVPKECGFALHNRGCNFSLDPTSPNALRPSRRPYHTIIPAMMTRGPELYAAYGVMGGFMQPQGHLQVALNMLIFGMNPQEALDAPRICIAPHSDAYGGIPVANDGENIVVKVEEGIPDDVIAKLRALGHTVHLVTGSSRGTFGRGQIISASTGPQGQRLLHGGSDLRGDGAAIPQI